MDALAVWSLMFMDRLEGTMNMDAKKKLRPSLTSEILAFLVIINVDNKLQC